MAKYISKQHIIIINYIIKKSKKSVIWDTIGFIISTVAVMVNCYCGVFLCFSHSLFVLLSLGACIFNAYYIYYWYKELKKDSEEYKNNKRCWAEFVKWS